MSIAPRQLMLFATLALGSFALGAATVARLQVPVAPPAAATHAMPVSAGDPSVPAASSVSFGAGQDQAAPTF